MTLEELEQVPYKMRERRMLIEKIDNLYASVGVVSDTVNGSLSASPYTKHTIKVSGFDAKAAARARIHAAKLRKRINKLEEDIEAAQNYIDEMDDVQIRLILEYRFIDGYEWNAVALRVYDYPSGDRARKVIERYFKKI